MKNDFLNFSTSTISWTTIASRQCLHAQIHKLASVFSRTIDQYCHVQQGKKTLQTFAVSTNAFATQHLHQNHFCVCKCSAGAQIKLTNLFCASSPHRRICLSYWAASSSLINGSSISIISIVGICNLDRNYAGNQPLIHMNRMYVTSDTKIALQSQVDDVLRNALLLRSFSFYILIMHCEYTLVLIVPHD